MSNVAPLRLNCGPVALRRCLVVGLSMLLATSALASEPIIFESGETAATLVELFTSEGCSSCPAAEKWLSQWKNKPDLWKRIVPVAFHVDYWDHLGWRDRFARPEFTERQRHYATEWKSESVYTPGFAVNGSEWKGWFSGGGLPASSARPGTLRVTIDADGRVSGVFSSSVSLPPRLELEAALLGCDLSSDVKRGENSGRKLMHDFVVLQFDHATMSKEGNQARATLPLQPNRQAEKPNALAVWVRSADDTTPIQVTGGWLTR